MEYQNMNIICMQASREQIRKKQSGCWGYTKKKQVAEAQSQCSTNTEVL